MAVGVEDDRALWRVERGVRGVLIPEAVEEVLGERPHVGAGQDHLAIGLERALVGREDRGPVAAAEADPDLRPGVRDAEGRELPRHRAGEAGDLGHVDVRQHPRAPGRDRKEVVVDDDEGLQRLTIVAQLDDAHASQSPTGAHAAVPGQQ